ncbi:MAG: carboxypeptidase regulatory-like domain-containing protein [Chloroflexi bacterium]|nr:carboxypeptidase regulatory-like domain-containing protein [Chloroflexota bacterium]
MGYWGADWEGAIEVFHALYQLQPDYKDTRQRLYDAHVSYANVLAAKGEWCAARDQYDRALAMSFSDELKAKREEAAQSCAVALLPTSTPPPSGTFVGRVVKIDDVGLQTAMMIRGQVLNAEGKPIPNVQVGLSAWDWSAPPATTNQEGIFAFDGLGNPVTYTVTLINLPAVPLPVKADWSKLVWVEFRPQP